MSYTKYCPDCRIGLADLHIHTNASDGACSPQEIINMAIAKGLSCIALTDHDTIAGIEKIELGYMPPGLTVLPGIEISTEYQGNEVHILGYNLNIYHPGLRQTLRILAEARQQRISRMVKKLEEYGLTITLRDVESFSRNSESMGRPHLAQALIQNGYAATIKDAFDRYLLKGRAGFVPRYRLAMEETIALIVQAGGLPVLAHPGNDLHPAVLPHLLKAGLRGIEVFYPEHDEKTTHYYYDLAVDNKLLVTGGSDFHGQEAEDLLRFGTMPVPAATIEILAI